MLAVGAGMLLFSPIETPARAWAAPADLRYWRLPTGSRLAYTHFPARGQRRAEPLVFLHGGPGAPLRASEYLFFGRFADEGYDVYLYEQIGVGHSDSPADVGDYTVQRHVDDLEAIRAQIGADRLILVGQSWGAALAAHYTARHPQRVAALVLPSPGPMLYAPELRPDPVRTAAGGAAPLPPPWRVRAAHWLLEVNPALASDFAPPAEMNRYLDGESSQLMRMAYCAQHAQSVPREAVPGFNFYANRLTQRDLRLQADPRPSLAANGVPVLVVKGECDYVPRAALRDYAVFPNARVAIIEQTGHLLWGGQPELSYRVISAFLDGRPLPVAELTF
jgi:proline iminopeptidase